MMVQFIVNDVAPMFQTLGYMSLAASGIGLSILAVRQLADGKISPHWKYALWLLMLVALVLPYRLPSRVAVLPTAPTQTLHQRVEEIQAVVDREMGVLVNSEYLGEPTQNLEMAIEQQDRLQMQALLFEVVLPAVWLAGVVLIGVSLLMGRLRLSYHLATLSHPAGAREQRVLAQCKSELGMTADIALLDQSYIQSPALLGLLKPKILLPTYVEDLSDESLRYVILHELVHVQRRDLAYNGLLLVLQMLYWFNPIVWILFRFVREDMELCVDEKVLSVAGGEQKKAYARSLVEVLGQYNKIPFAPKILCMVDNKEHVKRRIKMIQLGETFKKHKMSVSICCLALIVVLGGLFLTAKQGEPEVEDNQIALYYWQDADGQHGSLGAYDAEFVEDDVCIDDGAGLDMVAITNEMKLLPPEKNYDFYFVNVNSPEQDAYEQLHALAILLAPKMPVESKITLVLNPDEEGDHKLEVEKGLELYVWKEGQSLWFNLLEGTNRNKTAVEIYNQDYQLTGKTDDVYDIGKLMSMYAEGTNLDVTLMSEEISKGKFEPYSDILADHMLANSNMSTGYYVEPPMDEGLHSITQDSHDGEEDTIQNPLEHMEISSPYGNRTNPVTGVEHAHNGIDLREDAGADIHAVAEGVVLEADYDDTYGYNLTIDHGDGFVSRYAHCEKLLVAQGDSVTLDTVIATVGQTGAATGPHLHLELSMDGVPFDPTNDLALD